MRALRVIAATLLLVLMLELAAIAFAIRLVAAGLVALMVLAVG